MSASVKRVLSAYSAAIYSSRAPERSCCNNDSVVSEFELELFGSGNADGPKKH